jgi:hypothetical protein
MALQKEALDLVASFPDGRRIIGPAQAEALLRIDARLEPVLAQLAQQYAANYQKSTDMETRLWHAVFDLVKAFAAAYAGRAQGGLSARGAQALGVARSVGARPPRPLPRHRREVPAVPLRHVGAGAVARIPRAL